jgi:hypothetical protein
MVHRDPRGGTLLLDIRLGKLGRYKAASGTDDVALYRDLVAMLRQLRRARQWDVLALVVQRQVAPLELYDAYVRGRLETLATADDLRPLAGTITRWLERLDRAASTAKQYTWLLGHFGDERATLADVPQLLEEARLAALRSGHRTRFNGLRVAVRQLLAWAVTAEHRLYRAVARIEPLRVERRQGNPQTVDALRALATALADLGPMAWALALTGMRRGEYFGRRFEVRADRLLVHGTKSKAAERTVPLAYPIAAPSCSYDHFADRVRAVSANALRVHDFRYTFTRWCEDAGIATARIRWYLGHASAGGDVTMLYRTARGFTEYLGRDAERLRAFVGEPPRRALEVAR